MIGLGAKRTTGWRTSMDGIVFRRLSQQSTGSRHASWGRRIAAVMVIGACLLVAAMGAACGTQETTVEFYFAEGYRFSLAERAIEELRSRRRSRHAAHCHRSRALSWSASMLGTTSFPKQARQRRRFRRPR